MLTGAAGGATTDLGLVEVHDPSPELPVLKQVAQVSGVGVGSTMIDVEFRELVCFPFQIFTSFQYHRMLLAHGPELFACSSGA